MRGVVRAAESIRTAMIDTRDERAPVIAISGIDGSGKTRLAGGIRAELQNRGLEVAVVGVDAWLNLPLRRFGAEDAARHFYEHAIRFDAMFQELIIPLASQRSHTLTFNRAEETASRFRRHTLEFNDIDVILVEGIFLLRRELRQHFQLAFWVDCSFETALERAIARRQEGLAPEATAQAYRSIYFPAQRHHFKLDNPRQAADRVILNDWRLED